MKVYNLVEAWLSKSVEGAAEETVGKEVEERKVWWEWLAPLWLGPLGFLKGKDWVEEHSKEINKIMVFVLAILILIAVLSISSTKIGGNLR